MAMEPHTKIINAVAKQILAPKGFFQRGRSRVWLQDNGWFLTVVEFQPSGFSKGTFVNVAMHFLWGKPVTSEEPIISFDYGRGRLHPPIVPSQYIDYDGDDAVFAQQVEAMVKAAVRVAEGYKRCTDLSYARRLICIGSMRESGWYEYDRAMLCFLMGDSVEGMRRMRYFVSKQQGRWDMDVAAFFEKKILPNCDTPESAQQMLLDMIQETRASYLRHSSYCGMSAEPYRIELKSQRTIWQRLMARWKR